MTWIPLLLADPSPCLRYLVIKDLLRKPDNDKELVELAELRKEDPLIQNILALQKPNGAWDSFGLTRIGNKNNTYITSMIMQRLGYLGFDSSFPPINKAADFLFSLQFDDGSWPLSNQKEDLDDEIGYQMMPIQTTIPLLGLTMTGYALDDRCEKAYNWLLDKKLDDGAWPVGISAGVYGGIAGYRHLAHSKFGCRSSTTSVLSCFAYHPKYKKSKEAKRALDLILGTNLKLKSNLGFTIARLLGVEKSFGLITIMAKFDIAYLLNLCWRVGVNIDDDRLDAFIDFIRSIQGKFGIWEYIRYPQISRWLTYDLLKSLSNLTSDEEWISLEPNTPFRSYSKKIKRY